ncbi:serine hydrolase [Chlorogloeopsis sp. ULAP02]|uniref:serine hydrolase n=1 Tax=Chlorogloeopsis sp. ULAP02 TaxID=3107926 RepID=UPI0031363B9F
MSQSRRVFLLSGLSGAAATTAILAMRGYANEAKQSVINTAQAKQNQLAEKIIAAFSQLPGKKGLKFWIPADAGFGEWSAMLNPDTVLFCASAFKGFVLAEFLRFVEETLKPGDKNSIANQLNQQLSRELVLDESVFSPGAPVFNPPNLSGKVTVQTVLEAMISRSDNTATDMALKQVGADRVRQFIAEIGLQNTRIPTSTRQFFGYIIGYPEWQTITWAKLIELLQKDLYEPKPILNDTITMAASPHDFVSFYSRALQGKFFKYPETLNKFRAILSLADAVALSMPLGVNGFGKGGSIDFASEHVLTFAGGMWVSKRWVYFSMMINWTDKEAGTVAQVQQPFIETANKIFTSVRDSFGC